MLGSLGIPKAVVIYPGGPVEAEVGVSALLGAQLSGKVNTMYRAADGKPRSVPNIVFVNAKAKNSDEGYWDGLEEQLRMLVACGAADAKNTAHALFPKPCYPAKQSEPVSQDPETRRRDAANRAFTNSGGLATPETLRRIILGQKAQHS